MLAIISVATFSTTFACIQNLMAAPSGPFITSWIGLGWVLRLCRCSRDLVTQLRRAQKANAVLLGIMSNPAQRVK